MAIRAISQAGEAADIVAIFDAVSGIQLFEGARPIKASVSQNIRYMKHPQEDGGNVTDHRIIEPTAIALNTILDPNNYRSTYQRIRTAARESTFLTVQTKTDTFTNMVIAGYPSEEDPALYDTITMNLTLEEIQTEGAQVQILATTQVRNASDSSTVDRGAQNGTDAGEVQQGSVLSRVFQ